ncbi:MAG TPA: endo-1,3-alpha-glucanase family glycosylhydrolase [Kiritimatiellia bacterium]|nr:endo-1,3-alpha-glucanase family glycosylhydrolase [Kiritimatiellia bacterium]HPS07140.1 endo-1,3-alpha-glucanase family glycosylhydrolase [Kiritimatiellia bacterium]
MRSRTWLSAMVLLAGWHTVLAGGTPRCVFAHYMVCIPTYGGNATVADYQREIRDAQAAGIDGFALNCGGWTLREPHYRKRALLMYQAALEMDTGFKLFISADYATGLTPEETRDMVETFRAHPCQFRHDGKPVLSTFGGGAAQTEFVRGEFTGRRAITYVPFYYPHPAAEMPNQAQAEQVLRDHPSVDGYFHFGAAGTPDQIIESNRLLAQTWQGAGKLFMAGITPCYRGLGGNYRVYETDGFEGYARQWEGAIQNQATWVEIVTWNDWGEASYVAPFGTPSNTNHWNGHWGPMLPHAAFLSAGRYYVDWYKNGRPPAITEDALYYFYRTHPNNVPALRRPKASVSEISLPGGAANLKDNVHATMFLTAPARLTIHSGDTVRSFEVAAGVHHVAMPFAPGLQRFVLTRRGATLIEKTGEHAISPTDTWGNFNLFAGEARPAPRQAGTSRWPRWLQPLIRVFDE